MSSQGDKQQTSQHDKNPHQSFQPSFDFTRAYHLNSAYTVDAIQGHVGSRSRYKLLWPVPPSHKGSRITLWEHEE